MSKPITVAIAGLGNRGRENYAQYALKAPEEMKIVAVADPIPERVKEAAEAYQIPPECCFSCAEAMLEKEQLADAMLICTPDRCHSTQVIAALGKGYHVLLEKPIAPTPEECTAVLAAARESNRHLVVCHVLRYTPFYRELKRLLDTEIIGETVAIQAIENVGYYHQAHSFVRGNWRNAELSSPMILQKCCHDMDILLWLAGKPLEAVSSFGGLYLFRKEKAPEGATDRCLSGCAVKADCPYDAEKIYITDALTGFRCRKWGWPLSVVTDTPTEEALYDALRNGPYGRCVYHCDNDVVDHQVVNLQLGDGVAVSFAMSAFTATQHRHLKIMGTMGDIVSDMEANLIYVTPFGKPRQTIDVSKLSEDFSGHGGGDNKLMAEFLALVRGDAAPDSALTTIERSMESHFAAFAAESSRLKGGESMRIKAE